MSEKCMKCGEHPDGGLPICSKCRAEFKDSIDPVTKQEVRGFVKLAEFLNAFEGDKGDLIWLIKDELANRQSLIISMCEVDLDYSEGTIGLKAPDGNLFAKKNLEEIHKLHNALSIVKKHYGG